MNLQNLVVCVAVGLQLGKQKLVKVHAGVRKMASALNLLYDDKMGYEKAIVNSEIASSEKVRPRRFRMD